MSAPTERQAEVLWTIDRMTEETGYPPTVRELCDELGIDSTNGIADHIQRLVAKGLLKRVPQIARGLILTQAAKDWKKTQM
jgi:repressor LexA